MSWACQLTESYALAELWAPNGERKWKPFAPEGTPPVYPRDQLVDLRHLKAEITLDVPGRAITGRATLTLSALADSVPSLAIDAEEMTIREVTCDGAGRVSRVIGTIQDITHMD